ncbi:MAG: hypothetical protein H8D45_17145 [Bacteroidetes bacterium]|nr:hypothetical protein [Bacteroidota bacterium]MBL7105538.1 hypothetical protein [Bacteroidales bacterium]
MYIRLATKWELKNWRLQFATSNLFIIGEGSGYAGGIMSSAADGIRAALKIAEKES